MRNKTPDRTLLRNSQSARLRKRSPFTLHSSPFTLPSGITLMEVLISMFVLLFGLMGVAAIFPVGNHYVVEGEKWDNASLLTQQAFEDIEAWGMLNPEMWVYSTLNPGPLNLVSSNPLPYVIQPRNPLFDGFPARGQFNAPLTTSDPGHVFVIDPLGTAYGIQSNPEFTNLDLFPYLQARAFDAYWDGPVPPVGFPINQWPLRRVTLTEATGMMTVNTAETIFRLRDDLSYEMPDQRDRPGQQLWRVDANQNPIARQFRGHYSWLATVAPLRHRARNAMQPTANIPDDYYDVSVVVFHQREFGIPVDLDPEAEPGGERRLNGQFLSQRELVLYGPSEVVVDNAVKDVGPRNWIAVMGINERSNQIVFKWYRILAMDDETGPTEFGPGRYLTLAGPDWPESSPQVQVALFPGVIDVVTKPMQLHWGGPPSPPMSGGGPPTR